MSIAQKAPIKKISNTVQKKKEIPTFEFNFNANAKPIVDQILQEEHKITSSFFSKSPKVTIEQISSLLDQKVSGKELVSQLSECLQFYKSNEKMNYRALEALGRLFLEAASKERVDSTKQQFYLFWALDLFSMSIQHSTNRVNTSAAALCVSIFKIAVNVNRNTYQLEKEILKEMTAMVAKKDLADLQSRERITKLCMKSGRLYEALYHLIEFEKLMKLKSRSMYLMKAGEIQFRKASVFQSIIDFYVGIASHKKEKDRVVNMGRLHSFIYRFNMDNKAFKITPLTGTGPLQINKTLGSLISAANVYYAQAADNQKFRQRYKAYYCMARNNMFRDKIKVAIQNLQKALETIERSPLKQIEKGNEKLKLLEYMHKIYAEQSMSRRAEEVHKQIQELRTQVRAMESQKRDSEKKK